MSSLRNPANHKFGSFDEASRVMRLARRPSQFSLGLAYTIAWIRWSSDGIVGS